MMENNGTLFLIAAKLYQGIKNIKIDADGFRQYSNN